MAISFFVRCLTCKRLNPLTLDPCDGSCTACTERVAIHGEKGLFSDLDEIETGTYGGERIPVNFVPIDATAITESQLKSLLIELQDYDGLRVVFIDEGHRLIKRKCDEQLLKPIEQKDFVWIIATANPEPLEEMFMNRLIKEDTETPTPEETEQWVIDRCTDEGIVYQEEAVMELTEKCECVVGQILLALARASIEPDGLTSELVAKFRVYAEC